MPPRIPEVIPRKETQLQLRCLKDRLVHIYERLVILKGAVNQHHQDIRNYRAYLTQLLNDGARATTTIDTIYELLFKLTATCSELRRQYIDLYGHFHKLKKEYLKLGQVQ